MWLSKIIQAMPQKMATPKNERAHRLKYGTGILANFWCGTGLYVYHCF